MMPGYQTTGMIAPQGPVKPQFTMPTAAQRQAEIDARMGPRPEPMRMRTAEERQADINARMGPGYAGPQYGGSALGAQTPVVPEGYTQVGNRYLSPSVMAAQAQQQAANPAPYAQAQTMPQDPDAVKQNVINSMLATGQPYTGGGTWSEDGQRYMPSAVERGIGIMGRAGTGNLLDATARSFGNEYGQIDKLNTAADKFAVTPDVLKRMTNNPAMAEQFYSGAKSISPKFNRQVSDNLAKQRAAYEAYMAQVNAANARKNSGGGFFGSAGNFGNFLQGMNPFAGVGRIASGEGKPTDYLKLAKFFL